VGGFSRLNGSDSRAVKMRALKSAEHAATRSCVASSPVHSSSSTVSVNREGGPSTRSTRYF
jgi:hypothetical protein